MTIISCENCGVLLDPARRDQREASFGGRVRKFIVCPVCDEMVWADSGNFAVFPPSVKSQEVMNRE